MSDLFDPEEAQKMADAVKDVAQRLARLMAGFGKHVACGSCKKVLAVKTKAQKKKLEAWLFRGADGWRCTRCR